MKMKGKVLATITAAGYLIFAGVSAHAASVVFDPTNWIENYATAISNIEQYAQQVDQYVTQLKQLRYQVQSLKNLDPNAIGGILQTAKLDKQLTQYQHLQGALFKTYGSMNQVNRMIKDTNNFLSGQGMDPLGGHLSWKQYRKGRVALAKQNGKTASEAMSSTYGAIKSANGNIAALKSIDSQIKNPNQTMKGEMETMNGSLNVIAHQNQQLLQAIAPAMMIQEQKARQEAATQQMHLPESEKKHTHQTDQGTGSGGQYMECQGVSHFSYTPSQLSAMKGMGISVSKLCGSSGGRKQGGGGR